MIAAERTQPIPVMRDAPRRATTPADALVVLTITTERGSIEAYVIEQSCDALRRYVARARFVGMTGIDCDEPEIARAICTREIERDAANVSHRWRAVGRSSAALPAPFVLDLRRALAAAFAMVGKS